MKWYRWIIIVVLAILLGIVFFWDPVGAAFNPDYTPEPCTEDCGLTIEGCFEYPQAVNYLGSKEDWPGWDRIDDGSCECVEVTMDDEGNVLELQDGIPCERADNSYSDWMYGEDANEQDAMGVSGGDYRWGRQYYHATESEEGQYLRTRRDLEYGLRSHGVDSFPSWRPLGRAR